MSKLIFGFLVALGIAGPIAVTEYNKPTQSFFLLEKEISGREFSDGYKDLITTLDNAREGDEVIIILQNNRGGRISTMLDIITAMMKTKAVVWTKAVGYTHSAALDILFFGDNVLLPYGPVNIAHMTANNRWFNDSLIVKLKYFKKYMSPEQFTSFINDGDVFLSNKEVCGRVGEKSLLDNYCVVRNRRLGNV